MTAHVIFNTINEAQVLMGDGNIAAADMLLTDLRISLVPFMAAEESLSTEVAATPEAEERRKQIVALADDVLGKDGELEFDSDAKISEGYDNGAYVRAWAWLSFVGTKFDKDPPAFEDTLKPDSEEIFGKGGKS